MAEGDRPSGVAGAVVDAAGTAAGLVTVPEVGLEQAAMSATVPRSEARRTVDRRW
jgi:hypothetical protein